MGCITIGSDLVLLITAIFSLWCPAVIRAPSPTDGTNVNQSDYTDSSDRSGRSRVKWQTDPFSDCSSPCGGGQQHRLIRCIREDLWTPGVITEIPTVQCPSPRPNISQPCNTQMCLGSWRAKPWSGCSVTCGEGIQKRDVVCESYLWKGHQFQVADVECGGDSPDKYRKCYERECPYTSKLSQGTILSENYTLFQIRRAGRLKVNIGGRMKILPGQTVMVKCLVRHYSRRMIYWSKDNKMIPHEGRVMVTAVGLRILKADPKLDGGIYTCMAGERKATITIQFTSKRDPLLRDYRNWAKKSRRRYRKLYPNRPDNRRKEGKHGKVVATSYFLYDTRQHDQGANLTKTLSFIIGNWSECSVTCGSRGQRHRKVFCADVNSKYIKMVEDEACFRQGVKKPVHVRACAQGPSECPVWRPGPWSKCDPWCGDGVGRRSRILVCEWENSRRPALDSCDMSKKPVSRKVCKPTSCPKTCQDSSRKCRRVRQFRMCRFKHFREKCCHSCRDSHPNKIYSLSANGSKVDNNNRYNNRYNNVN